MNPIIKEAQSKRKKLKEYQKEYRRAQSIPETAKRRKKNRCTVYLRSMNEAIFEDYFSFIGKDLQDGFE